MSKNSDFNDFASDRLEEAANNSWLALEIQVRADQKELLQGLEAWLRLGLISQEQVKRLAHQHLSCDLPLPKKALSIPTKARKTAPVLATPRAINLFQTIARSFLDELSIRWLLFLGIFLVVVSSGVLAASQWQNFPDFGQYLVLLIYTFVFWGIGFWTGKQSGLKLTSQSLTAIATLLIPINFWAINYLGLRDNYLEWAIASIATIVLTGIGYLTLENNGSKKTPLILNCLFGLLSYAHLAWHISDFPLVAIYGGIIAICTVERLYLKRRRRYPTIKLLYVFTAWSLLLVRNLINSTYNLPDYSLAIAIFAWLISSIYLTRVQKIELVALKHKSAAIANAFLGKLGKIFSIMLFITAWSISILAGLSSPLFLAQTIGISMLAIHLFNQRLILYWYKRDLTAIFLIGLQALYVSRELIPSRLRGQALDLAVEVSKTEYFPESVLGVTLFPYLFVFVLVASWLYRRHKTSLAIYTEFLTLCLGIVLTCLSFSNPSWRSLNLLGSTLTLGYVVKIRQPIRSNLVYFTHLLGLVTIVNAIALMIPNLNRVDLSIILLAISLCEWSICIWRGKSRLKPLTKAMVQSCWYFGLSISAISYTHFSSLQNDSWGLLWLAIPAMLTLVAKSTRNMQRRRWATVASCLALIAASLLVIERIEVRIIALAIATGLMYFNALNLRRIFTTAIHLGLAICLVFSGFDLIIDNTNNYGYWLLIGAMVVVLLYRLRLFLLKIYNSPQSGYISQRIAFGTLGVGREAINYKLVEKYIRTTDYWAIALIAMELLVFMAIYLSLPTVEVNQQFIFNLVAIMLTIGAIFWRYHAQPNNLILYSLTGLWGILAAGLVRLFDSSLALATCNIILGLSALAVVALLSQRNTPWTRLNLAYVPLVYAVAGIFWRLSTFNAYSGFITLGAAFIALNTRQQNRQINRTIKYFGFAGVSCGIYELVLYQLQFQSGGNKADLLTILALVAAAIAFCYRFIAWQFRQRSTIFNLHKSNIVLIAHFHWVISSFLKIIAAGIVLETSTSASGLTLVSIATSFCLGAYAIIQAKDADSNEKHNDWWVYVGLVEITASLVYSRLIISKLSLLDPWRIVFTCAIALLIYQIPWQNFGWRSTPWQRTALIIPILMALVTAEDITYFSLLVTAAFYLRIAYAQGNIRWSYISLGLLNWLAIRIGQYSLEPIWLAGIISLSILYIAQFDSYLQRHSAQRHYLRLFGSSIFCLIALIQQPGIVTGAIAFCFIFAGLGLKIRAFLFAGTITLIFTVLHQLIILMFTYSFLKWIVGLVAGIGSIVIAAGFEQKRGRVLAKLQNYSDQLRNWQ